MSKEHHLKTRKGQEASLGLGLPLNFLLGCTQQALEDYALARLGDVADTRRQVYEAIDQLIQLTAQSIVAEWFRKADRTSINQDLAQEESPLEWAKRKIRESQRSKGELEEEFLPGLPLGAAHLAAAIRYQERNIAEGKCQNCPQPLDRNSVRYCTKHLLAERSRYQKKGKADPGSREYLYSEELQPSTHGREPSNLALLEMNREKKTRSLLAELGIPPESAAVTLKAVKEALLREMPDSKAKAMNSADLFQAAVVPSTQTGKLALRELLAAGKIQRIGKGIKGNVYRYFVTDLDRTKRELASQHAIENAGRHLRGPRG